MGDSDVKKQGAPRLAPKKIIDVDFQIPLDEDSIQTFKQLKKLSIYLYYYIKSTIFKRLYALERSRRKENVFFMDWKRLKGEKPHAKFRLPNRKGFFSIELWQVMKSGSISTTQNAKNHDWANTILQYYNHAVRIYKTRKDLVTIDKIKPSIKGKTTWTRLKTR